MEARGGGPETVRQLMTGLRNGEQASAERLVELFYAEPRRMAAARMMRERPDHTLQPTALVNELYLEIARLHDLPPPAPTPKRRGRNSSAWPAFS